MTRGSGAARMERLMCVCVTCHLLFPWLQRLLQPQIQMLLGRHMLLSKYCLQNTMLYVSLCDRGLMSEEDVSGHLPSCFLLEKLLYADGKQRQGPSGQWEQRAACAQPETVT